MRRMLSRFAIRVPRIPARATMFLLPTLLAGLPAMPVDETRYLSIAWEMRHTGDLLTLHLNDAPYFDKPPLLFWLIDVFWSMFGATTWAVVFFAAGCIALLSRLEKHLAGAGANEAPWLLAGFVYFALFACGAMFDIGLTFFVLLAFLALVRRVQHGGGSLFPLFVEVTFGVLMKGPVLLLHLVAPWH
jgi:4-amino-4-deoxy-L-arabinose transferase-like glycosyltransferase